MAHRAFIGTGMAGVVLAAVCCVAPLFVAALPLAGVGAHGWQVPVWSCSRRWSRVLFSSHGASVIDGQKPSAAR